MMDDLRCTACGHWADAPLSRGDLALCPVCEWPYYTPGLTEHPDGPTIASRCWAALCGSDPEVQINLLQTVWRGAGWYTVGTIARGEVVLPLRLAVSGTERPGADDLVDQFVAKARWWVDYLVGAP